MANTWKRVRINFNTVKLGDFIEPLKNTYAELNDGSYSTVYGVSNTEGICITGKEASKDISKYIVLEDDCFAFNPYRINVGSIGINSKGLKGCVSPAYIVFKTNRKLNPYFLYHFLKSNYGNHLINWYGNKGGVRNALRYDDLCQIDIPDVDLPTQLILLKNIQNYNKTFEKICYELNNQSSYLAKLRQAILQEAIEGKLTESWRKENPVRKGDPDFDAEALLEKIQAEKEKLIKKGKIKKQKPLAPIKAGEVPKGWVWTRLGEVCSKIGSGSTPKGSNYTIKGYPFFRSQNIYNTGLVYDDIKYINKKVHEKMYGTVVLKNDLLLNITGGSLGRCSLVPENFKEGNVSQHVCILRAILSNKKYFHYLVLSSLFQNNIFNSTTGAGREGLPKYNLELFAIPLPPLAEQQAIVDRVEKLLAIIDKLEKQVSERKEQSEQLMQAVLRDAFEGGKRD